MHTLFPEPVAPATNKWGSFVRSQYNGELSLPVPIAIGKARSFKISFLSVISSFKPTTVVFLFGTSMPTSDSPGIGDWNLMFWFASANARSFSLAKIWSTLTLFELPKPGVNPYIVTEGPDFTWSTETSIPCSLKVFSISSFFSFISFGSIFSLLISCSKSS